MAEILPHLHLWVSNVVPSQRRKNLLGNRVGDLMVIFDCGVNKSGKNTMWLCSCKCGNLSLQRTSDLSLSKVKSCGCSKRSMPQGKARFNHTLSRYKRQANQRGFSFELTEDQAWDIMAQNCHYCGTPPSNVCERKTAYGGFVYSGIDRVDNRIGYTFDNSVPCCHLCNWMKKDLTSEDFLDHVEMIHRRKREKLYGNITANPGTLPRQSYGTCPRSHL